MAGYRGRTAGAQHVYDDLFARCLALETDDGRYAIVSLDVMGVDTRWVEELRRRAGVSAELPAANLLVATTHTHAAQGGLFPPVGSLGSAFDVLMGDGAAPHDPAGYEWLLRQTETVIRLAFERLAPASLAVGEGSAEHIAANRIWFERAADPRCLVVAALSVDGASIGQLVHFNCHPTVLGEADLGISGDFPGAACRIVEAVTGAPTLFLNGALGDVSTRTTRRDQSYGEVTRFGRLLSGEILKLLSSLSPSSSSRVVSSVRTESMQPRDESWLARIEERIAALEAAGGSSHEEARQLHTAREGAQSARRAAAALAELPSVLVEIQQFELGDTAFVAVPGEIFSDAQFALEAAVPDKRVRIVAPANGYMGYFPSAEAYDHGSYEVGVSLVERGSAEQLVESAAALLRAGAASAAGAPR